MSPQLEQYLTALFLALAYDGMTFEQALDHAAAGLSTDKALKLRQHLIELVSKPEDVAGVEEACRQVAHRFGYSMDGSLSDLFEAIVARGAAKSSVSN